jgi:hypothetical protein
LAPASHTWHMGVFIGENLPQAMLISVSLLWQNTWAKQLKEERFLLSHGFRDFNPWSLDSVVSGPKIEHHGRGHAAEQTSLSHCEKPEGERECQEGAKDKTSLQRPPTHTPTASNQVPLLHFPIVYSNFECIRGLFNWWRQSHHDMITSWKPHLWTWLVADMKPSTHKIILILWKKMKA